MLEVANKYEEEIKMLAIDTWYNDKYKFYHASNWHSLDTIPENNWDKHTFASVNKDGEVIGYIGYSIDRASDYISSLWIINFSNDKVTFGKDVTTALSNIFEKYNFRKIVFNVVIGNPIEKQYDKLIHKYGGRIVGTYKDSVKLIDNKYYDEKIYEIFREDYLLHKVNMKHNKN